jgi:NAD(P)-dependent dehydrogenase (short-subunit alcohol dehydrogenase family)
MITPDVIAATRSGQGIGLPIADDLAAAGALVAIFGSRDARPATRSPARFGPHHVCLRCDVAGEAYAGPTSAR